jgi:hypothetical protein
MSNTTWKKLAALGGIAYVVLQLASQSLMQLGGAEPAFNASSQEILEFFVNRNYQLANLGGFLSALSIIAFLWFLGSLWGTLRGAEGDPAWLSFVAVGSGLLMLATISASGGGWALAIFRIEDQIDPQIARLLFDQGNFSFASMWVSLASFLFATGVVVLKNGGLPRWLAWAGIVIAGLLLIARAFWAYPSMIVFMPYVMFWLWLIATSISLVRRAGTDLAEKGVAS